VERIARSWQATTTACRLGQRNLPVEQGVFASTALENFDLRVFMGFDP
jgi:hypothetical protein